MAGGPWTFRQIDVVGAIDAVKAAGLQVFGAGQAGELPLPAQAGAEA